MNLCLIGFFTANVTPMTLAPRHRPIKEMACNYVLITSKRGGGEGVEVAGG